MFFMSRKDEMTCNLFFLQVISSGVYSFGIEEAWEDWDYGNEK